MISIRRLRPGAHERLLCPRRCGATLKLVERVCVLNEPRHRVARVNAPHVLNLCMDSEDEATSPLVSHIPIGQPQSLMCLGPGHTAMTCCGGDQQQLATNTRVRGLTSKQWKPMRNHILATHGCDGVSPQSRSCAPGLKAPVARTRNDHQL